MLPIYFIAAHTRYLVLVCFAVLRLNLNNLKPKVVSLHATGAIGGGEV
jgi:hypothetical protein